MRNKNGEIKEKWVSITYDYVPKYCKTSKLQGYNENKCFVIHPKLKQRRRKMRKTNNPVRIIEI